MQKLSIIAGLVLALAGCGKKDKVDQAIADLEGWRAKMCECKDKACADKVAKKAEGMLTDDTIKKHGEKGMDVAFGVAMCLAQHQAK